MSAEPTAQPPSIPQPTGQLDAAERAQLGPANLDAVAATLLNLVAEVASLAERVRALEAGAPDAPTTDAAAVHDFVRRIVSPLAKR